MNRLSKKYSPQGGPEFLTGEGGRKREKKRQENIWKGKKERSKQGCAQRVLLLPEMLLDGGSAGSGLRLGAAPLSGAEHI